MTIRIKKTEEMKKADKARRNKEYYEKCLKKKCCEECATVLRFGASKGQGRDNYQPPKTPTHLIVKQGPITLKFD